MSIQKHKNIHVIEGVSPILVSAPHAVPIRKRTKTRVYTRRREAKADELVKRICENSSAWGMTVQSKNTIQNWRNKGGVYPVYRETIDNIIHSNDIELFVDVHGAKKTRPFLVDYDFVYPKRHELDDALEKIIWKAFTKNFPSHKISKGFFRNLNGPGTKTFTHHVRKNLNIPAVQLEINKSLKMNPETFTLVADSINELVKGFEAMTLRESVFGNNEGVYKLENNS